MPRRPDQADVYAGARLKAARRLAGMSQSELGNLVNVSFQQIQKYEKGLNRIGASRLQEFVQILNVPPAYFFQDELTPEMVNDEVMLLSGQASMISPRLMREMLHHFHQIPSATMRNQIALLVKACAEAQGHAGVAPMGELDAGDKPDMGQADAA